MDGTLKIVYSQINKNCLLMGLFSAWIQIWFTKSSWRAWWVARSLEKILKGCRSRVWSNQLTLKIPLLIIDTIIALLLNDHVMQDHASSHDLPHWWTLHCLARWRTMAQRDCRTPNARSTWSLWHLLFFREPTVFLLIGFTMCLHKNMSLRVDTIS
jgi:hypothetical protein